MAIKPERKGSRRKKKKESHARQGERLKPKENRGGTEPRGNVGGIALLHFHRLLQLPGTGTTAFFSFFENGGKEEETGYQRREDREETEQDRKEKTHKTETNSSTHRKNRDQYKQKTQKSHFDIIVLSIVPLPCKSERGRTQAASCHLHHRRNKRKTEREGHTADESEITVLTSLLAISRNR